MEISIFSKINNLFYSFCVITTVSLTIYCICNYLGNEDLTVVKFTKFHSSHEDVYPSFSFCISPPFLENKFDSYGNDVNLTTYANFLDGKLWDERMLDVDYDNVTVTLADNVLAAYVALRNNTEYSWSPKYRVSFRSLLLKCFTIDAPDVDQNLNSFFEILIKPDIFPRGRRPQKGDDEYFLTYLHYPGQRFTSSYTCLLYTSDAADE